MSEMTEVWNLPASSTADWGQW